MNEEGASVLLIAFAILPIGDAIATAFFARLFWRSKAESSRDQVPPGAVHSSFMTRLLGDRSWLLALLTASFAVITIVFVVIGLLAVRRMLGFEPLQQGAVITIAGLFALGLIPIAFMFAFLATRRARGGSPPPFGRQD